MRGQLLAIGLLSALAGSGSAQGFKATDYQVKAVYLVNFVKFVEWPAGNDGGEQKDFKICVWGQDPFGATLENAVAGESVNGRSLVAKRVASAREAAGCRVIFVSEEQQLGSALATADRLRSLSVSDLPPFLKRGGMIQFVPEGNRIRFEVNLAAVKSAGLSLSSELLRVALAVHGTP